MSGTQTGLSDRAAVISEIERNLWETWAKFGCGPGSAVHEEPDARWFETPLPILPYNGALRFQDCDNAQPRIEAIIQHYMQRADPFMWVLHPSSRPDDLARRLLGYGLKDIEPLFGMARSLADLPEPGLAPAGIEIRQVSDEHDAGAF